MCAQGKPSGKRKTNRFVGWIFDRPLHLERIGMMVQRASGVGLLVYFVFHLIVTSSILDRKVFGDVMGMLSDPVAHLGEIIVVAAVGFHGINGLRILLLGTGIITGRPARPDFPYRAPSLNKSEKSILWTALGGGALSLLFASFFILVGG